MRSFGATLIACAALSLSATARADEAVPGPEPVPIFGGGPSATCAWPSTVFLENCTGTLIHPEIVVYAAHCGDDRERVWFGEDVSTAAVAPGSGFSVDVEYCKVNPEFATAQGGEWRAADYAFCKLAEPVLDVPIVPPLMGCETTLLLSGTPVTLVGFGGTDDGLFAVKHEVVTELHYIDDWGAAVIGGDGLSPCAGDSGGPAFMQMPDGTWRAFGIVSGPNVGNCSDAMWFATIYDAIPFIERESGIDVTVCHGGQIGEWNPSPGCGGFPLEPGDGSGKSWADGCAGGAVSEASATCGPPFDAAEDLVGPSAAIVTPEDRERYDTEGGASTIGLLTTAEIADTGSGVSTAALTINGAFVEGSLRLGRPWEWPLTFAPGVWEIRVEATDWAGNVAVSDPVVIGVDMDPPPAPEPSSSSGDASSSSSTSDDATGDLETSGSTTGTTGVDAGTDDSTGGSASAAGSDDGCGCTTGGGTPTGALLLLLLARALRGRRRGAVLSLAAAAACGGGGSGSASTDSDTDDGTTSAPTSTSSSSTTSTESGSSEPTSSDDASTSTGDESSTTSTCVPGTLDCHCTESFTCDLGLACRLDTCVQCELGTLNCPCIYEEGERTGECDGILNCFGGLCVNPQPCPYLEDLECDEPEGTGVCLEGTDVFDCCAVEPGVCEEESVGGACPNGSDPIDCGADTDTATDTDTDTDTGTGTESGSETDTDGASGSGSTGASTTTGA